jgi:hypothetical protein
VVCFEQKDSRQRRPDGGIIGSCRSAWLIGRHPEQRTQRVLAAVKNNLAPPQPSLAYAVVADEAGRPQVAWLGPVGIGADQLLNPESAAKGERPARQRAADLLHEALASGPRPVDEVLLELAAQDVSRRTLFRAGKELGVVSEKPATEGGRTWWRLPCDGPYAEGH